MWERWRAGESLQHIAQLFDRNHSSVARILAQTGGIQPPPRRRSKRSLTLAEREENSRGLAAEDSFQWIARRLSRAPSTICREIKRNSGDKGYRADFADELAWQRALRPKACKLATTPALAKVVAAKLQLEWSPQQVAGWLKRTRPDSEGFHVSHETIYRTLFIQARGALKKELLAHLRRTRAMRRSRHHTQKRDSAWKSVVRLFCSSTVADISHAYEPQPQRPRARCTGRRDRGSRSYPRRRFDQRTSCYG